MLQHKINGNRFVCRVIIELISESLVTISCNDGRSSNGYWSPLAQIHSGFFAFKSIEDFWLPSETDLELSIILFTTVGNRKMNSAGN